MESLSSSVDICPGGTHDHCQETAKEAGPALQEICSRYKATKEQVRLLRARNDRLSEELSGLAQRLSLEALEQRRLLEAELGRLRQQQEEEAEARSAAEAERRTAEAESAALLAEREQLEEQLRRAAEGRGEKEAALRAARRRAEICEAERAEERDRRLQQRAEAERLRATVSSLVARVQLQEGQKRRLREELQFQQRVAERQEAAQRVGERPEHLELERSRAEHARQMEEARREADRRMEAAERELHRSYEEKFQELLNAQDNSASDLLRQQNLQLTQSLARLTERTAAFKTEKEKLCLQLADKAAAEARLRRDLQESLVRARRLEEDAERSARSEAAMVTAIRSVVAAEAEAEGPDACDEQPTQDNADQLNWTSNAAYHKPGNPENVSKSKPGHPRLAQVPGQPSQQS